MNHRIYIYVNGILSYPGCADNWTDRAVTWTHVRTDHRAEKFEYFTGPLTRRLYQTQRAQKLARMISFYQGWEVVLVAHSNGCDVALRAIELLDGTVQIEQIHMIAAACEADILKNGLEYRLQRKDLKHIYLYIGGKDYAMEIAKISSKFLGCFGLGYGSMGGLAPEDAREMYGENSTMYQASFGHSTWFEDAVFDLTMQQIIHAMPLGDKDDSILCP